MKTDDVDDPIQNTLLHEYEGMIDSVLIIMKNCLTEAQYTIICNYYGLDGRLRQPSKALAKECGVSAIYVRKLLAYDLDRLMKRVFIKVYLSGLYKRLCE